MATPPAVKASNGRWDPCASGTCCDLVLWSPSCILLGCVWETDGGLSPGWEEQGTALCWRPGGVRDLVCSSRLRLLTIRLSQGNPPFLRFVCRGPPEVTCRPVCHLPGLQSHMVRVSLKVGESELETVFCPNAVPSPVPNKPCVPSVSSGSDPDHFLPSYCAWWSTSLVCWAGPR